MAVATTTTSPSTTRATAMAAVDLPNGPYIEWGAIILGTLAALTLMVVLMTFGTAIGLSSVSPHPYAGLSAKAVAILAGLYAALVHVASFGAGGYLAGRLRTPWATADTVESNFRDGSHGFAVWSLGVVVGAALALSGIGAAVKATVEATTTVAAAGAHGAASNPQAGDMLQQVSMRPTDVAVDRLLAPGPGAPGAAGANAAPGDSRADLAGPVARTFARNLDNPQMDARDRTWLASLVSQRTGLAQAEAEKRVDDAFAELKAAEQKARDAADKARKATLVAAFAAAATLAIGAAAACAGAALGARHRDDRADVVLFGSRRFW